MNFVKFALPHVRNYFFPSLTVRLWRLSVVLSSSATSRNNILAPLAPFVSTRGRRVGQVGSQLGGEDGDGGLGKKRFPK